MYEQSVASFSSVPTTTDFGSISKIFDVEQMMEGTGDS